MEYKTGERADFSIAARWPWRATPPTRRGVIWFMTEKKEKLASENAMYSSERIDSKCKADEGQERDRRRVLGTSTRFVGPAFPGQ